MKTTKLLLAAVGVTTLGASSAFAQGRTRTTTRTIARPSVTATRTIAPRTNARPSIAGSRPIARGGWHNQNHYYRHSHSNVYLDFGFGYPYYGYGYGYPYYYGDYP